VDLTTVDLARAYGLDVSLLRSCMQRTPTERLWMACVNASDIAHLRRRPADYGLLLDRLLTDGIRFVLVGSMAAAAHGSAYIPNDLDICYDLTAENLGRLSSALMPIHPRPRCTGGPAVHLGADIIAANPELAVRTDAGDLDLLDAVDGVGGYRECLAASEPISWGNAHVRVLVPEALIISLEERLDLAEIGPLLALRAIVRLMVEGPAPRGCNLNLLGVVSPRSKDLSVG